MQFKHKKIILLTLFIVIIVAVATFVSGELERREHTIAEQLYKEGVYHYNQQEFIAASTKLSQALSNDPTYYKARYWLGKAYFQSGYIKHAIEEWEMTLNLVGDDPLLSNKISRLLYQLVDKTGLSTDEHYVKTEGVSQAISSQLSMPCSIHIDKQKNYWVVGYASNSVVLFDKNGNLIDKITHANRDFKNPYDIVTDSNGGIYISDFGHDQVHKFDADRNYLFSIGKSGLNDSEFYGPQGLAVDQYDNVFVVDSGNHRVQKFDKSGNLLLTFGKSGAPKSKDVNLYGMLNPSDVVVLADKVYVSDTGDSRLQIYDLSGNWIESMGEEFFKKPKGIKVISSNEILVADDLQGIVQVTLNPYETKIIKAIDQSEREEENELSHPLDMAIDDNHFLYVADSTRRDILAYIPEQIKYNNLDINIIQTQVTDPNVSEGGFDIIGFFSDILTPDSLIVTHRVEVKDPIGNPILGLQNENFTAYEEDTPHNVRITSESKTKKGLSVVVLNEKSQFMKGHKNLLEKLTRPIIKSFSPEDQLEVINFSHEHWVAQPFVNNELSPLNAILENKYHYVTDRDNFAEINNSNEVPKDMSIGEAFYKSVSDVLARQHTVGAVIIITSGKMDETVFMPYGYDVCVNYAKNNHIPIYILSFSDGSLKPELEQMTADTGGKYFNVQTAQDTNKIAEYIRKQQNGVYYVQYNSKLSLNSSYQWRVTGVEVKLKDLFGQDRSGYYIR